LVRTAGYLGRVLPQFNRGELDGLVSGTTGYRWLSGVVRLFPRASRSAAEPCRLSRAWRLPARHPGAHRKQHEGGPQPGKGCGPWLALTGSYPDPEAWSMLAHCGAKTPSWPSTWPGLQPEQERDTRRLSQSTVSQVVTAGLAGYYGATTSSPCVRQTVRFQKMSS
jgi:hypothetical protein